MTEPDIYMLGREAPEEARLKQQIADLAPDSDEQFVKVGIKPGQRVVDLGCGPGGVLHLLGKRWEPAGRFSGSSAAQNLSSPCRFVSDLGMTQVEVRQGDAYDTGLPRASFDGAHMRLVLVNVPKPETIVREMIALVRPGGWIASFEADLFSMVIDPPSAAYERLATAYGAYARSQGIDLAIGRRTHRLFREAGLVDIDVDPTIRAHPLGYSRRTIFRDFINNVRVALIASGVITRGDLERDLTVYEGELNDPNVLATSCVFYRVSGRVPTGS